MPMPGSPRCVGRVLTGGLLLLMGLAAPCVAQNAGAPASGAGAPAASPPAQGTAQPTGMRIGAIDVEKAFEKYEKARFIRKQIADEVAAKNDDLRKRMDAMQQLAKELQGLDTNSNDFRSKESEITRLKAEYEASREQAQSDLARREAESLATIYKDIQSMTDRVARYNKLQFVVKVTSTQPSGSDPNTVMAAMSHSIVYFDPSLDVTNHVVHYLNSEYKEQGGTIVPPPSPVDEAAVPTSARNPAPATGGQAPSPSPARTATAQPAGGTPR